MKNLRLLLLIPVTGIILSGCAATYKHINPPFVHYNSHELLDGVSLSYKYDVLRESNNKKYANKEIKKGIKVVAVKVTNNTDSIINIGKNVALYCGENRILPMNPLSVKESIRQIVPGYLPYLILTITNLYVYDGSTTQTYPIGYVLGPGLTILNTSIAGTSNKNMLSELNKYNILNMDIQKGETVFGLVGFRDIGYQPLSLRKIK